MGSLSLSVMSFDKLTPEARIALLLLEELALRGGQSRLRYLKTYRYVVFWLGEDYAKYILDRLVQGRYIAVEKDRARLLVKLTPSRSYMQLLREIDRLVREMYRQRVRV